MFDAAKIAIERPLYPWIIILSCLAAGWYGIETVGRLEDPVFDFGMALVITPYPGASAEEVEQEVTDVIETSIQELPQLEILTSKSVPGRSEVTIEVYPEYMGGDRLPQVWDEMRRRVSEAQIRLPPGAGPTIVEDDFGDVYGILYAVSTPNYSPAEIQDISRHLSNALKSVYGVAKVTTAGEPEEAIYVELDRERLTRLGIPIEAVFSAISIENQVLEAGSIASGNLRFRITPPPAFDTVSSLGEMRIGKPGSTEIIRLADVANIKRETVEVPRHKIRHQGEDVFTLGISVNRAMNVVEVGERVDEVVTQLLRELPLGVTISPIYQQHLVVKSSIDRFLENLMISIATVIGALCIFMGWRAGAVVGSVLFLTILGTIGTLSFFGIALQRISLGALMIAMGMLVDNAIVVTEGMVVGVKQGKSPKAAASESVRRTQYPLLGATVIGILAFAPIGLSADESGQFLRSLLQVVFISLMLSWVLAISVVPLLGNYLLRKSESEESLYSGALYAPYRAVLRFGLRRAWLSTVLLFGVTGTCFYGLQFVKPGFFPFTNTPIFFINYYLPQGTDINRTASAVARIEEKVLADPEVVEATSFIGRGSSRFMLIIKPEQPNPAYAQIVVRVTDVDVIDDIVQKLIDTLPESDPDAEIQVYRTSFTSSSTSMIEARFSGPDANVLRALGEKTLAVYMKHRLIDRKLNWRQRELTIVPQLDEARSRIAGINRQDVARALAYGSLGVTIGLFREADKLIPIIARAPADERSDISSWPDRLIWSPAQQTHIPASQIISRLDLKAEDTLIYRRQRTRTLTVQANPPVGHNTTRVHAKLRGEVEAIDLPPGYNLEWGGEYEASQDANRMLFAKIPLTFGIMFFITILMFGSMRQPLVIWLTVPMSVCGVAISLLATNMAFTFPSFLGFLSLSGMLIKNCIILVDEIDKRLAESGASLETIMEASVTRLRPVLLAAGTTIAGMSPLLRDAFFAEMAVSIMGGLAFATILTLVAIPVFYRIALRV